jgi:hypothetical protein
MRQREKIGSCELFLLVHVTTYYYVMPTFNHINKPKRSVDIENPGLGPPYLRIFL